MKKFSYLKIIRIAVQLIFFILLPGLFINAFVGLKQIIISLVSGNFNLASNFYQIFEFLVIIPVTILMGRFFCGWMCAFGTLGDILYAFSKKILKLKYKISENLDNKLKYIKFLFLVFIVIFIWILNIVDLSKLDPWNVFGIIFKIGQIPDFKYIFSEFLIGVVLLIIIMFFSLFIERFFCRYLCPLGGFFELIAKITPVKIRKSRTSCGSCKLCTNACSMGIPLNKYDKVPSGECINCYKCISVCPRNNVTASITNKDIKPVIVTTIAVSSITVLYLLGSLIGGNLDNNNVLANQMNVSGDTNYKDGTYEGSGTGFRNAITKVSVTVLDSVITDIEVISHGDDKPYFDQAYNQVVNQILSLQSTDVDTVSGATYSSEGIISAVEDALDITSDNNSDSQANSADDNRNKNHESNKSNDKKGFHKKSNDDDKSDIEDDNSDTNNLENAEYIDGTYEGSARGFRNGVTTVSVEIESGKITNVEVISHGDDDPYFDRSLSSVVDQILNKQSTDVDSVSGATYSSKGIMNAVEDALKGALK